jgi:hypothetical protein
MLLDHSIKMLPCDEPGWITSKEVKSLFSPKEDQYAFGEMDEVGKQNLASFAAGVGDECLFEFMPVEDRVYFKWIQIAEATGPMPKSRAEMLHAIVRLIDEYSAFQRSRPDLPQGNLWGLSQDELEQLVAAFQQHKAQQTDEAQRERPSPFH